MGFVYHITKAQDIYELKNFLTLLNNENYTDSKNKIALQKHDKIIVLDKNNIDFEQLKNILEDQIDYPYEKLQDINDLQQHDYEDLFFTFGTSSGNAEFYLKNLTRYNNKITIGNKIKYYMTADNIEKLNNFITFLYSVIDQYNNENNTFLENFDRVCDSNEDPITSEEWD